MTAREYLSGRTYPEKEIQGVIDESVGAGGKYDGELGWVARDGKFANGINKTWTFQNVSADGCRQTIQFADTPCRINTYGDSFTQGAQVSDGETWQEFLAAHIGEPVRNYGVGSYSVYQAYLRMLREEEKIPADNIIFGIYDDDHFRNLDAWQGIRHEKIHDLRFGKVIWKTSPYIEVEPRTGLCRARSNPCPTPESLYLLTNLDKVCDYFKDDLVLEIMLSQANENEPDPNVSYKKIENLSLSLGIDSGSDPAPDINAGRVHAVCALKASQFVVGKVDQFAKARGKKVLYVLFPSRRNVAKTVESGDRFDDSFVDFLKKNNLDFVDMLEHQIRHFEQQKLDIKAYLEQYYTSHYSPLGNFFAGHTIRDRLVEKLDPKPPAYRY